MPRLDLQEGEGCKHWRSIYSGMQNQTSCIFEILQGQMRCRSQVIKAFGDPRLNMQNKAQHAPTKNCREAQLSASLWPSCWPRSGECSQLCSVQCYSLTNGACYDSSVSLRIVGRSDCLLVFNFNFKVCIVQSLWLAIVFLDLGKVDKQVIITLTAWGPAEMRYLIQLEKHPD